jgi:hypothetical protein
MAVFAAAILALLFVFARSLEHIAAAVALGFVFVIAAGTEFGRTDELAVGLVTVIVFRLDLYSSV